MSHQHLHFTRRGGIFVPTNTTNLRLLLDDARTGGQTVNSDGSGGTPANGGSVGRRVDSTGRHFSNATVGQQAVLEETGFNGMPTCRYDGTDDVHTGTTLTNFISTTYTLLIVLQVVAYSYASDGAAAPWMGNAFMGDTGGYWGLNGTSHGGGKIYVWHYDSAPRVNTLSVPAGTKCAILVWQSGTTLYSRLNNNADVSVATSGTGPGVIGNPVRIGGGYAPAPVSNSRIPLVAMWNTDFSSGERDIIMRRALRSKGLPQ